MTRLSLVGLLVVHGSLPRCKCDGFSLADQNWAVKLVWRNGGKKLDKLKRYGIILSGATILREAGQGRNPAALSDLDCVLFFAVKKSLWN